MADRERVIEDMEMGERRNLPTVSAGEVEGTIIVGRVRENRPKAQFSRLSGCDEVGFCEPTIVIPYTPNKNPPIACLVECSDVVCRGSPPQLSLPMAKKEDDRSKAVVARVRERAAA